DTGDGNSDTRGTDTGDGNSDTRGTDTGDGNSDTRGTDTGDGNSDTRGTDTGDGRMPGGDTGDGGTVHPSGFIDVDPNSRHAADIGALAAAGIAPVCSQNPLRYCPEDMVTRAQMASFFVRALRLPTAASAGFLDVDPNSIHAADINNIYAAGITVGCSPLRYCPDSVITRARMASFFVRALRLPAAASAGFLDVDPNSIHAADIDALWGAAGLATVCGQSPLRYCPDSVITRAQMASFLVSTLNLPTS
ncbi:MAG: hypothetical protein KTU85_06105, partial [Acidimicrobiia bacterium]|nr:hypothetical protein [Acidimicrobiia bacterium]